MTRLAVLSALAALAMPGSIAAGSEAQVAPRLRATPLIEIGGPFRLPVKWVLRIPVTCTARCSIGFRMPFRAGKRHRLSSWGFHEARTFPASTFIVLRRLSYLEFGALKCKRLNPTAYMEVNAFARNLDTGERETAQKTFRFKPAPNPDNSC